MLQACQRACQPTLQHCSGHPAQQQPGKLHAGPLSRARHSLKLVAETSITFTQDLCYGLVLSSIQRAAAGADMSSPFAAQQHSRGGAEQQSGEGRALSLSRAKDSLDLAAEAWQPHTRHPLETPPVSLPAYPQLAACLTVAWLAHTAHQGGKQHHPYAISSSSCSMIGTGSSIGDQGRARGML